ncbi:MAG TPA: DUF2064 domain-containing protein [Acidimicrobiales bacterium]|jgi:glycosyltransferase A (GT-A) superfamily protein (DUF2064 family)|nr:DUF2064 domain-containing protein [Acidimicrobiales bacterium]
MRPALIVLAEDPAGGVPGLTDDARVADTLLARTLTLARAVGGVGRVLLFSPPEAEATLTSRSLGFRLWPAEGDTPGARYANAFRQSGELGYEGAVVIGLGVPTIPPQRLTEAAALLEEHQGVLIPDGAGGVAVLGLQGAEPTLFPPTGGVPDHDTLCTRARQQRVRLHELPPHPALTPLDLDDHLGVAAAG